MDATALVPTCYVAAIKLRKKPPLLLERVGVRRLKNKAKALFDALILTLSLREKGLSILNLMAVTCYVGTRAKKTKMHGAKFVKWTPRC
ncbi:hypothetical protein [Methylobacter tundripaludum]|uniref:hypothetical protein n=1 Tax=Methylobacter tundripaludum TaxID=173365 RepID=UPI0004DF15FF|nr:hypothetical protein [Methylobacter tundripaludum]